MFFHFHNDSDFQRFDPKAQAKQGKTGQGFRMFSVNGGPIIIDDVDGRLVKVVGVSSEPIPDEELSRVFIVGNGSVISAVNHPLYGNHTKDRDSDIPEETSEESSDDDTKSQE